MVNGYGPIELHPDPDPEIRIAELTMHLEAANEEIAKLRAQIALLQNELRSS